MNKSWNYYQKTGGANPLRSAGELGEATPPTKKQLRACAEGRHKWQLRRKTRKCVHCGAIQTKNWRGEFE